MTIAITGGTGFVGRHLARDLVGHGHRVVLIARGADRRDEVVRREHGAAFAPVDVADVGALGQAFSGCSAIAHLAGINREHGFQTYRRVHVEGTQNVLSAARAAGVGKVVLLSFLRARPDCGSPYHESKWAAEELVRQSGLDYTILKAGIVYGRGDHMLDRIAWTVRALPLFAPVGMREALIRPTAVQDLVAVLRAALVAGRLSRATVAVLGPEAIPLSEAVRRVGKMLGQRVLILPLPVGVHYGLAWLGERLPQPPLASVAQVRMLAEGMEAPLPGCELLPLDLAPRLLLDDTRIREGLLGVTPPPSTPSPPAAGTASPSANPGSAPR